MNPNHLNTEEDIERAFQSAVKCFKPPAGLKEAISRRLDTLQDSEAFDRTERTIGMNRDRIRVFLKIARWAMPSAAACAAAVLLVVSFLSGPDIVESAYAGVIRAAENSRASEWVRATRYNGQVEMWVSLNPYRVIWKSAEGDVIFDEVDAFKALKYDPKTKTIQIHDSMAGERVGDHDNLLDYIMSSIQENKNRGAVFEKSEMIVNGTPCLLYHVRNSDESRWKKVFVDVATHRLVRVEVKEYGWRNPDILDFDYPKSGPEDIYALGVPLDARIEDVRTRDEQSSRMLVNVQRAERQFDSDFRAVVVLGPFDQATGKMVVDEIDVYYQTQYKRRIDSWHGVARQATILDTDDTKAIEQYITTHGPSSVVMTAPGGGNISYNLSSPREVVRDVDNAGAPAKFQNLLWKTHSSSYGKSLPDLEGDNGRLQGTQRVEPARVSEGVVHGLPIRRTIYLNPRRDYLLERYEKWRSLDESWVPQDGLDGVTKVHEYAIKPHKTTTMTLEYAKTPFGHWYPKRQVMEGDFRGRKGVFMRVIHVDTMYKLPEELFSPEAFERQLDRPVKSY